MNDDTGYIKLTAMSFLDALDIEKVFFEPVLFNHLPCRDFLVVAVVIVIIVIVIVIVIVVAIVVVIITTLAY